MIKKPIPGWKGQVRLAETEAGLVNAKPLIVQTAPFTKDTSMDSKFVIGQRSPYAILEGATSVSGSLTAPFEDETFAKLTGIQEEGPIIVPEETYVLGIFPDGFENENEVYVIKGVRFGTFSFSLAPDDIVEQTLDWTAEESIFKKCEDLGKKDDLYKKIMESDLNG